MSNDARRYLRHPQTPRDSSDDSRIWARSALVMTITFITAALLAGAANATDLRAGVAKVDITDYDSGPVNDPLYVKALVLRTGDTALTIITVDVVAIGEYGRVNNDYLPAVRSRLEKELGIQPRHVLVNASHCHGRVCRDVADRTFQAVENALKNMVPVKIGAGVGREDRIMENRRFTLKDGTQVDSRRAYSLPPDESFASVGPMDPEIGILRLDKADGQTLAVIYNFACHPIQGVPSGGNTADVVGFASKVIEDNMGDDTLALFLQGCAGDINPAFYKDVAHPHDAEPLGNLLGLSTLRALKSIMAKEDHRLTVINETIKLPRADFARRIEKLEAVREELLQQLRGTTINLKTFIPLMVRYSLSDDFPSHYAHRYMHEEMMGWEDLKKLDARNRDNIQNYINNIYTMEELTRVQTNLSLLRKHQAVNAAVPEGTIHIEVLGVRIGEFVLVTFPGELTVQIGLNIKETSPHDLTFVAGYTNGYVYYAPTAEQLRNSGQAQEDSDSILAPEWQQIHEDRVAELLKRL